MSDTRTLYDQVKDIEIIGARLGGDSEVVCEIEDWWRANKNYPIIRDEITAILQASPNPFPMNYRAPQSAQELTPAQFATLEKLFFINPFAAVLCSPDLYLDCIQVVIWQAVALLHNNQRKKSKQF